MCVRRKLACIGKDAQCRRDQNQPSHPPRLERTQQTVCRALQQAVGQQHNGCPSAERHERFGERVDEGGMATRGEEVAFAKGNRHAPATSGGEAVARAADGFGTAGRTARVHQIGHVRIKLSIVPRSLLLAMIWVLAQHVGARD